MWLTDALRRGDRDAAASDSLLRIVAFSVSWELVLTWLPIVLSMAFTAVALLPELTVPAPSINDDAFHFLLVQNAAHALSHGQNLIDHWSPDLELGFPQFHYYQHVPHVTVALLHEAFLGQVGLFTLFNLTRYVLLVGFPITVYFSLRTLGFSRPAATTAAALSPLFAGNHNYGFEYDSYIWRGFGMYTQLWAMHLSFITIALLHRALESRRGLLPAIICWALLVMCHLVYAYMTAITSVLILLMGMTRANARDRIFKFALIVLPAALITAYFWLPFSLSNVYLSSSPYLQRWKYDSFGAEKILGWLIKGDLWDHNRLPVMTVLAALGALVALLRRSKIDRLALAVFFVWLLLYFGRPTWGSLVDLMPMHRGLLFHRFIGYVDIGALLLIGVAGDWIATEIRVFGPRLLTAAQGASSNAGLSASSRSARRLGGEFSAAVFLFAMTALLILAMYPAIHERGKFYNDNGKWMRQTDTAIKTDQSVQTIIADLKTLPPGRTFAGLRVGYGTQMKVGFDAFTDLLTFNRIEALSPPYQSLSLNSDLMWDFDYTNAVHYNLFNVRYVVAPASLRMPAFLQVMAKTPRLTLYQAPTSGYFDLVSTDARFKGTQPEYHTASRAWLLGKLPGLKEFPEVQLGGSKTLYPDLPYQPLKTATAAFAALKPASTTSRGQILAEGVRDGEYDAQVQVDQASTLLLKVTYHPNWHATVDGHRVKTSMVMPSYIGVSLEPGKHDVQLRYEPAQLKRLLLWFGALTLGIVVLAEWQHARVVAVAGPYWRRAEASTEHRAVQVWQRGDLFARGIVARLDAVRPIAQRVTAFALRWEVPQLAAVAIIALVCGLPTLHFKLLNGHDAGFHLPRSVEFYEGLKAGQWFPRWAADFNFGYGEPVFNFYSPLFYYLTSFFHVLGFSFIVSEDLSILSTILGAALAMYLLARQFVRWPAAIVAATAYVFAPYFLYDVYNRHALPEALAFVFMPASMLGLYRFVTLGRARDLAIGSIATASLILSSNSIALVFAPVLGVFGVWQGWQQQRSVGLLRCGWLLVLGLGLSAFFWIPALAEQHYVSLERMRTGPFLYSLHFHSWQSLYIPQSFYGPYTGSLVGTFHVAAFLVALAVLPLILRQSRARGSQLAFFLAVSVFYYLMNDKGSDFIWRALPLIKDIQFPWRLLSITAFGLAMVLAFAVDYLGAKRSALFAATSSILIAVVILGAGLTHSKPSTSFNVQDPDLYVRRLNDPHLGAYLNARDTDFTPKNIALNVRDTGSGEYTPAGVTEPPKTPAAQRLAVFEGKASVEGAIVRPNRQDFIVNVMSAAELRASIFYFPGWKLYVDGQPQPLDHEKSQGLIAFSLPTGRHVASLKFKATQTRLAATYVSFFALAVLLTVLLGGRRLRSHFATLLQRSKARVKRIKEASSQGI